MNISDNFNDLLGFDPSEEYASFLRQKRRKLAYTRSLPVDVDRSEAHLRYGVLKLILPKTIKVTANEVEPAGRASRKTRLHS